MGHDHALEVIVYLPYYSRFYDEDEYIEWAVIDYLSSGLWWKPTINFDQTINDVHVHSFTENTHSELFSSWCDNQIINDDASQLTGDEEVQRQNAYLLEIESTISNMRFLDPYLNAFILSDVSEQIRVLIETHELFIANVIPRDGDYVTIIFE
jgi:hypothetical protein